MNRYLIIKNYGKIRRQWFVSAESPKDAMKRIETEGLLYKSEKSIFSNYSSDNETVIDLDKDPLLCGLYDEYIKDLKAAIELGMPTTPQEHEAVYGLPFYTIR